MFWIKMLTWQNGQGSQHSPTDRRQFMVTTAVQMENNQNSVAVINRHRALRMKFHDLSWLFQSLVAGKTGRCQEVILAGWGDTL